MDSSKFLSSKGKLSFWIIFPLFCLVIFYFSATNYLKSTEISVNQRKTFVELLPIIDQKISVAQTIIDRYTIAESEIDAIKTINSQLNKLASQTGFAINSLAIEGREQSGINNRNSVFKIKIKGTGRLTRLQDFFDAVFTSDKLISLESAKINSGGIVKKDIYSADIIFFYYDLY